MQGVSHITQTMDFFLGPASHHPASSLRRTLRVSDILSPELEPVPSGLIAYICSRPLLPDPAV